MRMRPKVVQNYTLCGTPPNLWSIQARVHVGAHLSMTSFAFQATEDGVSECRRGGLMETDRATDGSAPLQMTNHKETTIIQI